MKKSRALGIALVVSGATALIWQSARAQEQQAQAPEQQAQGQQVPRQGDRRIQGLESITVTARKIEEDIQSTPVSVTALTGADISRANYLEFKDVGLLAPNVRVDNVPSQGMSAIIGIRGVQQTDPGIGFDPSVGIYEDGIYQPRMTNANFMLLDLERVELLKGPQGTLFGKNTPGGAIVVTSKKPDGTTGGWLRGRVGEDNLWGVEGALGFPILGETLSGRVAFLKTRHDGYIDTERNPFLAGSPFDFSPPDDIRDRGDEGVKGALRWVPAETVEVIARGYRTRVRQDNANPFIPSEFDPAFATGVGGLQLSTLVPRAGGIGLGPAGDAAGRAWAAPPVTLTNPEVISAFQFAAAHNDNDTVYTCCRATEYLDSAGGSVTARWDLGAAELTSITGYRDFKLRRLLNNGQGTGLYFSLADHAGSPKKAIRQFDAITGNEVSGHANPEWGHSFSQEFQATGVTFNERLTWTTGIYYFDEFVRSSNPVFFRFSALPISATLLLPATLTALDEQKSWVESWGVYGQTSYRFTDRWSITLGLRTTYERRELERTAASMFVLPNGTTRVIAGMNTENPANRFDPVLRKQFGEPHGRWDSVDWTAGLEYQATDDMFLFFRAAKGFRSGGFNVRVNTAALLDPFDPEFVTTYELGMKSEWLDNRARVNAALYYSKYKDLQTNVGVACAQGVCFNIGIRGSADISGGELELATRLLPGLDLGGSLGVTWVRYTTGEFSSPRRNVAGIPTLEYALSGRYALPPFRLGELSLSLDWTWQSDVDYSTLAGTGKRGSGTVRCFKCKELRQNAHGRLNGRIAFAFEEPDVEIALYGNNLFNREYFRGGTDFGESVGLGVWTVAWNEERKFGAEVVYRFGSDSQR